LLLINESPLQALPSLACVVGINGAIILQQMHYWLQASEHQIEGYVWIYNSYNKWTTQFKWLKARSIQKHILLLEKSGYLISRQFKYKTKNNTKWYRIDYDRLNAELQRQIDCEKSNSLFKESSSQAQESNDDCEKSNSDCEESNSHSARSSQSLKLNFEQTTQKTTHKNIAEDISYIWREVLDQLKDKVSPTNFSTWLASTEPTSFDGTLFLVSVKSEYIADHLNKTMRSMIEGVLTSIVGRQVKFKCLSEEGG